MLRLHTFGTAHVACDGVPMDGAAGQRRLLAILSVLAVHGGPGVSRDKLLGLLWPEGDPDRSRHALTQSLYNLRRALKCEDVLVVGGDLRLNPARISSDAADFETALERNDLERAVAVYCGPFLDGFYVGQSPEFERWATEHRARFSLRATGAFDALGDAAERAGEMLRAAEWRRRRVVEDPLDSRAVMRLMLALEAIGELGSAAQHARLHAERLRDEIGIAPPDDFQTLASRLRVQHQRSAVIGGPPLVTSTVDCPPLSLPESPMSGPENDSVTEAARRPADATGTVRRRVSLTRPWIAASLILATIAALLVVILPEPREVTPKRPVVEDRTPEQPVVVAPFRVAAADPSLRYLHQGMVELLATRLAVDSVGRAVDPGIVLSSWRDAGLLGADDVSRHDAIRLARRLGARMLVTGSVVGGGDRVVLSATVVSLSSGGALFSERVDGPIDSLTTLVDRLATHLLASDAGETERLQVHGLPSLPAVRAFLNGQAAYRREQYAKAVLEFERALDVDSTFAIAALRLALAADKLNGAEQHDRALHLAWQYRDRLNAADRAHLVAFAGPRYPSPSSESEQLAAWDRAAMLAPDRSEVWQELGERFFFNGAVIGSIDWRTRATSAFRRAVDLDPSADWSRTLLLLVAARSADTTTLRDFATLDVVRDSLLERAPFVRWRIAQALTDEAELARSRAVMPQMSASDLRWIALSGLYDAIDPDDAERALRILKARTTRSAELVDVLLAEHSLALNEGRPIVALDVTEQLEQLTPASGAHLRLRVLDALYGDGDPGAADRAAMLLERRSSVRSTRAQDEQAIRLANLCVLEQWRLARGDRRWVARSVAELHAANPARRTLPVSTASRACADILDAMAAVAARAPNALTRVQRLDSLMLTGPAIGDAVNYAPIALARMYERLDATREALAAIRRRPYMSGWPRYLATARREEGRLARRLGEEAAAAQVLRRYLALRRPEGSTTSAADRRIREFVQSVGAE